MDNKFVRTDLALETYNGNETEEGLIKGVVCNEKIIENRSVTTLEVLNETGAAAAGKPIGKYITIDVGKVWLDDSDNNECCSFIIAEAIKELDPENNRSRGTLIGGLGNRYITADAIGPLTAKDINVTRHIKEQAPQLYNSIAGGEVSVVVPGVTGQTGIETVELIRGAVENVKPSLIIAIDALAARNVNRLATTVQLTNNGIAPGSGIGNRRSAIDKTNLGIPVISIGVPTVVDSSTVVYDVLEQAGIENISDELSKILENGKSYFVTLKDSDIAVNVLSSIIARAINIALGNDFE